MKRIYLSILAVIVVVGIAGLLAGCATGGSHESADAKPSGARLWTQNCARCHNSRSPAEFSPAQWDVVMLHMRVRAGLTAQDSQSIREFLQQTN